MSVTEFDMGVESVIKLEEIAFIMNRLNDRPRVSRGVKSPRELFLGQRVDLLAA